MKVSVFGLGYVGCVSAACIARSGHEVIGVDVNPMKVEIVNKGKSPIIEQNVEETIKDAVEKGLLSANCNTIEAVRNSDISMICVGTPSNGNGSINLEYIYKVAEEIGRGIQLKSTWHLVVLRSTVLPEIADEFIKIIETSSQRKAGKDWSFCVNPEFLREGSAMKDFYDPPFTLIGEIDPDGGNMLASLYKDVFSPMIRTSIRVACMVKYVSNIFHALKVSFSNEIGAICKEFKVDSHQVMDIFSRDTKLNISPAYLSPGFAFGGSCLPKDVKAMIYKVKKMDVEIPLLESVMVSNDRHVERALNAILDQDITQIGILGLSFKNGTDDLRESPMIKVAETLIGKGYPLKIFDRNVRLARIFGANRVYLEKKIPHISTLLVNSMEEVFTFADKIIIGNNSPEFRRCLELKRSGQKIIDLVKMFNGTEFKNGEYWGICW